jgi:hypothetical protein
MEEDAETRRGKWSGARKSSEGRIWEANVPILVKEHQIKAGKGGDLLHI